MLYKEIFTDLVYGDFIEHVRPAGDLIIDVGANSGLSALYFARELPDTQLLAIEPAPATYACLALNLLRHVPGATTMQLALAAADGAASLTYYPKTPSQSGLHAEPGQDDALTAAYLRNIGFDEDSITYSLAGLHEGGVTTTVPCWRLDTLVSAFSPGAPRPLHLKIDVERAELSVLEGVGACWPSVESVVCEVEDRDGQLEQVVRLLEDNGLSTRTEQQELLRGSPLWLVTARRRSRR